MNDSFDLIQEDLEAEAQYIREALKEQIIKLIEASPAISAPVLIQRIREL